MSEIATNERAAAENEKPVSTADDVKFPPYPEPSDNDFDEDITEEEKAHYKIKFSDLDTIVSERLHCTACDRHLGCSATNDSRMRLHPMLRTLICNTCHSFYNSGEFDKGEDGSELYCRWCGQGGQVYCCSDCIHVFCAKCIKRNLGLPKIKEIENTDDWKCFKCNPKCLWDLRAVCWALLRYCDLRNKLIFQTDDIELRQKFAKSISVDQTECCKNKGRRSLKIDSVKKKEKDAESVAKKIISKIPPTIQVKKFASVNIDDLKPKVEKKPQKRPASPKNKSIMIKNPIAIAPCLINPSPQNKRFRDDSSHIINDVVMKTSLEEIPTLIKMEKPIGSKNVIQMPMTSNIIGTEQQFNMQAAKKMGRPLKKKRGRPSVKFLEQQLAGQAHRQKLKEEKRKEMSRVEIAVMLSTPNMYNTVRFPVDKKMINLTRVQRPRIIGNNFNGFNNHGVFNPMSMNNMTNVNMNLVNDNINLSLDSLTQGLDFAAVQAMNNSNSTFENNDDVVCTPDFPLEPLCEVTEDNDDDVECITPAPVAAPKVTLPPPLVPVRTQPLPNIPKGNVIQMTDNDVTVNALTGGLKFRVDPQTLSSNKMYRLPDGRIFAINSNPNMPGGYSATIVSQNPDGSPKVTNRSETFAAKLSAVTHSTTPKASRGRKNAGTQRRKNPPKSKPSKCKESKEENREADLKVPVEWYRYNMIDAVDALEYSLTRLQKLKKETTSAHLRTRTVNEMKYLHRTLEQLLTTSSKRFIEIRDTLNKEMKMYLSNKETHDNSSAEEDDDDVEILPNTEDDPIFIDENSVDSMNGPDSREVDLTGVASSEHNDSAENRNDVDPLNSTRERENLNILNDDSTNSANVLDFVASDTETKYIGNEEADNAKEHLLENHDESDKMETVDPAETSNNSNEVSPQKTKELNGGNGKTDCIQKDGDKTDDDETVTTDKDENDKTDDKNNLEREDVAEKENDKTDEKQVEEEAVSSNEKHLTVKETEQDIDKDQDAEMSEEMIETLLKDDNLDENASMEISDLQEAEQILS